MIQEDHVLTKQVKGGHFAANQLCDLLEAIFLHELKDKRGILWRDRQKPNSMDIPEPSFWSCVDPLVSDEIKMQLLALRNSESDVKKCRSWIRLMLMKGLLLSFLIDIQKHPGLLGPHYGPDAVLKDPECSEIIIQLLKGLQVFEFEYDFTSPQLMTWDAVILQLAEIWNPDDCPPRRISKPKRSGTQSTNQVYYERVSPPPSDFLMEDAVVISALDKYSNIKRSMDNLTDDQILAIEEDKEDTSEVEEDQNRISRRPQTSDFSGPSYNTMLQSYARKIERPMVFNDEGSSRVSRLSSFSNHEHDEGGDDLVLAQAMNFEIVNAEDSMSPKTRNHIETLTSLLTKLETEKGLDSQEYQCAGCKRPIGIIFGEAKLCRFDGHYYCYECHLDDERLIPARVLFNWDFRKHRVCVRSCEFLDSIEMTPVINVEEANKALYHYIPELEEAKNLRLLLSLQKDYIFTCKDSAVTEEFKKRIRSSHFYDNIHLYSLKDLKQVYNGSLVQRLRKIVRNAGKHIRTCSICSQKGFICEICQKDEILFPFDEATYQCPNCKSVYHTTCKPKLKTDCPKCLRLEQRRASLKIQYR